MATSSVTSLEEESFSKVERLSVNILCERCSMPLRMSNGSNNDSLKTSLYSKNNEEKDDIVFIEGSQMLIGSCENGINPCQGYDYKARRDIIRPLLIKSSDVGRLNIELLDLMSDSLKADHPLCEECADSILDYIDQDVKAQEDDIEKYKQLLLELEFEDEKEDVDEIRAEFMKYQAIATRLQEELSELEIEKHQSQKIIKGLEKDCHNLEENTNKMLIMCPVQQYLMLEDDLDSIENQIIYTKNRRDCLEKTDGFRLAFHISCDDDIGVINGYRLGLLPDNAVKWAEINAAWGQTVLLLHSLSKLINFQHENIKLVPMSNHSFIKLKLNNEEELLSLFYLGDGNKTKLMEFDLAMVRFLNYFQKFKETMEENHMFRLPYQMHGNKIIDGRTKNAYSVRMQLNTKENWTRAMKFVLTNLRWAMAWSSTVIAS